MRLFGEIIVAGLCVVAVILTLFMLFMVLAWPVTDAWGELRDWWRTR